MKNLNRSRRGIAFTSRLDYDDVGICRFRRRDWNIWSEGPSSTILHAMLKNLIMRSGMAWETWLCIQAWATSILKPSRPCMLLARWRQRGVEGARKVARFPPCLSGGGAAAVSVVSRDGLAGRRLTRKRQSDPNRQLLYLLQQRGWSCCVGKLEGNHTAVSPRNQVGKTASWLNFQNTEPPH